MGRAGRAIRFLTAAAWILAVPGGAASEAAAQSNLEYSVKANYLVRFAAFVDWPASAFADAQAPVSICVVGRDPFGVVLDRAARDQTAHGRVLAVRRPATAEATAGCHILYVAQDNGTVARPGMLIVTDAAFSSRRGMIHFVVSDARVRFHIDLQAASHERLSISSRLLNLALTVRGG